jgi:hypothetical protein
MKNTSKQLQNNNIKNIITEYNDKYEIVLKGWKQILSSKEFTIMPPFFNFCLNLCGGTLGTEATTGLLYQPRMIGDGDCG